MQLLIQIEQLMTRVLLTKPTICNMNEKSELMIGHFNHKSELVWDVILNPNDSREEMLTKLFAMSYKHGLQSFVTMHYYWYKTIVSLYRSWLEKQLGDKNNNIGNVSDANGDFIANTLLEINNKIKEGKSYKVRFETDYLKTFRWFVVKITNEKGEEELFSISIAESRSSIVKKLNTIIVATGVEI